MSNFLQIADTIISSRERIGKFSSSWTLRKPSKAIKTSTTTNSNDHCLGLISTLLSSSDPHFITNLESGDFSSCSVVLRHPLLCLFQILEHSSIDFVSGRLGCVVCHPHHLCVCCVVM